MAGNIVAIKIVAQDQASSTIDKLKAKVEGLTTTAGFKSLITGVGLGAGAMAFNALQGAAFNAVGSIGEMVDKASDLNETINKTQVVFGKSGAEVIRWGEQAINAMGLSENAALTAAATYGNLFRAMGYTTEQSAAMSEQLVQLASDLHSFNNIPTAEVLQKLQSGLVGETEAVRSLGIVIDENRTKQFAYANGIAKVGEELTAQQKVLARYQIMLADTKLAQGDWARTQDGVANASEKLRNEIDNLQAKIGTNLLPVMKLFIASQMWLIENWPIIVGLAAGLAAVVIPALILKVGALAAAVTAATGGLNLILAAAAALGVSLVILASQNASAAESQASLNDQMRISGPLLGQHTYDLERASESQGAYARGLNSVADWTERAAESQGAFARKLDMVVPGVQSATTALGGYTRAMFDAGAKAANEFAAGLRSGYDAIGTATDDLVNAMKYALTDAEKVTRAEGAALSTAVARGLNDKRGDVQATAWAVVANVTAYLASAVSPAYAAGFQIAASFQAGIKRSFEGDTRSEGAMVRMSAETIYNAWKSELARIQGLFKGTMPKFDTWSDQASASLKKVGAAASAAGDKIKKAIGDAFERADKSAKAYFDAVHQRNLRAIDDARALADAQYEAAVGKVDAAVQAYRDELERKRTAREEAELRTTLAAATTDEERLRAEQALNDFLEDQTLARMEREADAEKDRLAAQKDAQDKQFDAAAENEDRIYDARVAAWEKASEALQAQLDKQTISYAEAAKKILAILNAAKSGFADAGAGLMDSLISGIKGAAATVASSIPTPGSSDWDKLFEGAANWKVIGGTPDVTIGAPLIPRAGGGPIAPTGDYLVGEDGTERLAMRGGRGYVTPLDGGGGRPVTINLTVDGRTLATIVDEHLFYKYRTAARGGLA